MIEEPGSTLPDPSSVDLAAFAELYQAHAAHLFDYCRALLGDEAAAASATEAALITAQTVLQDQDRMRAWLFALGRRECLSGPAALPALAAQPAEVADLVRRHGIRPEDVPTVLGVQADEVQALLAQAASETDSELTAEDEPLAPVPASVWLRSAQAVLDSRHPAFRSRQAGGAGSGRPSVAPTRKQVGLAAAILIPAAGVLVAALYLTGPATPAANTGHLAPAGAAAAPGTTALHVPAQTSPGPRPSITTSPSPSAGYVPPYQQPPVLDLLPLQPTTPARRTSPSASATPTTSPAASATPTTSLSPSSPPPSPSSPPPSSPPATSPPPTPTASSTS